MFGNLADLRGAHQEAVFVVVARWTVVVVMQAELRRVAFDEGVLAEKVGDVDLLVAEVCLPEVDRVQLAVGFFFQHVEVGQIVLPAV